MNKAKEFSWELAPILNKLNSDKIKRQECINSLEKNKKTVVDLEIEKSLTEEAQKSILLFLENGKEKSKIIFEEIGTIALSEIFGDGYSLSIEYAEKYSTSSAEIKVTAPALENDLTIKTGLSTRSGGLNDVVSIAFRLGALTLFHPEPEGPLMADETFKHLSSKLRPLCASVLRSVLNPDSLGATGTGRQFIFSTHAEEFLLSGNEGTSFADKVLRFALNRKTNTTIIEDVTDEFTAGKKEHLDKPE